MAGRAHYRVDYNLGLIGRVQGSLSKTRKRGKLQADWQSASGVVHDHTEAVANPVCGQTAAQDVLLPHIGHTSSVSCGCFNIQYDGEL